MKEFVKKTLQEQLSLLLKRSAESVDDEELASLSVAMVSIANFLISL